MNCPDQAFLSFFEQYNGEAIMLADWGFRCAAGVPPNVKLCKKGTWNERMVVETSFSLLTVVCNAKRLSEKQNTAVN